VSYRIEFGPRALAYTERLDKRTRDRVTRRIEQIAEDPYGIHGKALAGPGRHRAARVGGFRIVYTVDDTAKSIHITHVGPRGQIYRGL
jgi:mRNA interferase RelE/StbE